jgi:hypothetical protein
MRPWLYQFEEANIFQFTANKKRCIEHSIYTKLIRLSWVHVYMLLTHTPIAKEVNQFASETHGHILNVVGFQTTYDIGNYVLVVQRKFGDTEQDRAGRPAFIHVSHRQHR